MKRKIFLAVIILFVLASLGTIFTLAQANISDEKMMDSGKNFKVFDISSNNNPEYRYEIYDNHGNIVKSEIAFRVEPKITYSADRTLLSIQIGGGTGVFLTQYYDILKDLFSEIYDSPFAVKNRKVAYMELSNGNLELVVRDIFDKSEYYKGFKLNFSPVANPADAIINAKFLGESTLEVTYLSGEKYDSTTVALQLN